MVACAAFGCKNRSEKGFRMYGFPKNQERQKKWMAMVSRGNLKMKGASNNIKLCHVHFEDDQFAATKTGRKLRLKSDAVPTLFSHRPKPKRRKPPFVRVPPIRIEKDHTYCTKSNFDKVQFHKSSCKTATVQPYAHDPVLDPENDFSAEPEPEGVLRLLQDTSDWCRCGFCHKMPTEVENVCCQEIPKILRRMHQMPTELVCITDHPGFQANCLNHYVLQNISNIYKVYCGPVPRRTVEQVFRFVAYRSFVSWCWGLLGAEVRVVIPSCAVRRIRLEFPDPDGLNVGFQPIGFRPPLD
ncbi:uncharacterized protein LOC130907587 [Corythoichthys intestinalis]|uniref:uncharacterized protein LOC130907587 n=1 Tax=Corythoichthys intestinalis TaxID=161448 RepID=UPI0025A4D56D|nr:uncharacterized protein LOC130907587 [Corythoichthys intestinalis]